MSKRVLVLLSVCLLIVAGCGSDSSDSETGSAGDGADEAAFCELWDDLTALRSEDAPETEKEAEALAEEGADITEQMKAVVDAEGEDAVAEANEFFVKANDPDAGDMDPLLDYAEEVCDGAGAEAADEEGTDAEDDNASQTDNGDETDGTTDENAGFGSGGETKNEDATTEEKLEQLRQQCETAGLDNCDQIVENVTPSSDDPSEYGDDGDFDDLWDECEEGNWDACDDLFMESPFGSEYEAFGSTCGERIDTQEFCDDIAGDLEGLDSGTISAGDSADETDDSSSGSDDSDEPTAYGDDATFDRLWDECSGQDWEACDELFLESPAGSEYEAFGASCGERVDTGEYCVDVME